MAGDNVAFMKPISATREMSASGNRAQSFHSLHVKMIGEVFITINAYAVAISTRRRCENTSGAFLAGKSA